LWEDFFVGGACLVGCEEGFLEVGGNFFLSVLSASHPNTPNPSFSPKEGLSLVFFFYRGIGFPETALAPESLGKKSIRGN